MGKTKNRHDYYLDRLVGNLERIGENRHELEYVIKDLIWLPDKSLSRVRMCDLILIYHDDRGVPVELKGSHSKRAYAVSQVESGRDFIRGVLGKDCSYGKVVFYEMGGYSMDMIGF